MWPTFPVLQQFIVKHWVRQYATDVLYPWQHAYDPRHADGTYTYRRYIGGTGTYGTFAAAKAAVESAEGLSMNDTILNWGVGPAFGSSPRWPYEYTIDPTPVELVRVFLAINRAGPTYPNYDTRNPGFEAAASNGDIFHWAGYLTGGTGWTFGSAVWAKNYLPTGWDGYDAAGASGMKYWYDEDIECKRAPGAPAGYTYDASVSYKWLQDYATVAPGGVENDRYVTKYPLGPALPSTHADYSNSTFWTAAYNAAVAAGTMAAGLTYGVDYPVVKGYGYYLDTLV